MQSRVRELDCLENICVIVLQASSSHLMVEARCGSRILMAEQP